MTVLVAYASEHGSTQEIAGRIAARLGEQGVPTRLSPVADAGDLSGYDAFVVGSAIHGGDWLPAAAAFLKDNREALARRPLWLFSVSSVGEGSSAYPPRVARRMRSLMKLPRSVADAGELEFREHHAFAGVIRPGDWGLGGRVFMTTFGGRFGDHRNWQEIDGWAVAIGRQLRAADRDSA